jgi:hypothetical protein
MPLDRFISRFERSRTQANNTARVQITFILDNQEALRCYKGGEKKLSDLKDIQEALDRDELTARQMSYLDAIYEATFKALGFPSVNTHWDRPRVNLRHPK